MIDLLNSGMTALTMSLQPSPALATASLSCGVDEHGQRLAVADLAGDERGALLVVVGDDDLGDGGVAAEVPGEHLALHAGADDKDLHGASPSS